MYNIPLQIMESIKEQMKRPEGTLSFDFTSDDLFNPYVPGGVIFEIVSGVHYFKLERDDELKISFYHSSPGTGTRVSTVDLNEITPCSKIRITITWTTNNNINLFVSSMTEGGVFVSSEGSPSSRQFIVGMNGSVFEIGDDNVEVMGAMVYENGQPVLQPTALDTWNSTVKAVEVLRGGSSNEGYLFDVVVTNLTISILVTGFETYCKKRFIELEGEGIVPQTESLIKRFNYKIHDISAISSKAKAENKTILQKLAEEVINFQNYEECKLAYNKTYGLKFGDIGILPHNLERFQRFIKYRHRIIHVNALLGLLNQEKVPYEKPDFSNRELGEEVIISFNTFINKLHESTLLLKRLD